MKLRRCLRLELGLKLGLELRLRPRALADLHIGLWLRLLPGPKPWLLFGPRFHFPLQLDLRLLPFWLRLRCRLFLRRLCLLRLRLGRRRRSV